MCSWGGHDLTSHPRVSIVVPARNAASTISEQLHALGRQIDAPPHEVIVVDDSSQDDTAAIVSRAARGNDRIRLVRTSKSLGVNAARQAGAREATGPLILYCDADDVVDEHWVGEMASALATADLVGGRIDEHLLNRTVPSKYRTPAMLDLPTLDISAMRFVPGCNLGIRRSVLTAVGGWDVMFPASVGGDDVDLAWRCQLAGYRVGFVPTAVVHYRYRRTLRDAAAQSFRYGKSVPTIFVRFREFGCVRRPWWLIWQDVGWVLAHVPRASFDPGFRLHWVRRAAFVTGRLVACSQMRVFCL